METYTAEHLPPMVDWIVCYPNRIRDFAHDRHSCDADRSCCPLGRLCHRLCQDRRGLCRRSVNIPDPCRRFDSHVARWSLRDLEDRAGRIGPRAMRRVYCRSPSLWKNITIR